jgi:hypothetical protein
VAGDAGVHTFSATLNTAGSQSLTATDTATGSITGSQTGITVNPASASLFVAAGFASPTTAGTAGSVTVTAKDPYGNVATGYRGTLHFASSDGQAALPANYKFVAGDAGMHVFSVTLKTAGTQSLTATDTTTGSITGSQTGITVNPASASIIVVAGFPSPETSGVAGSMTVTAKDPYGNVATGYMGTVHFTSSDAQAALPANYKFVAGDAGVHTFSATLNTAGSQSLTATDTATGSITGSQTGITVVPQAAGSLVLAISAGGPAAGSFVADTDFSGGTVSGGTKATINTSGVTNPPPQSVLQHGRYGNFTYTIPNLSPGVSYTVRLDFVEYVYNSAGARVFNVAINGTQVLSKFDIWAAAGGKNIAVAKAFTATASSAGTIAIGFTSVVNNSIVDGVEIYTASEAPAVRSTPLLTASSAALERSSSVSTLFAGLGFSAPMTLTAGDSNSPAVDAVLAAWDRGGWNSSDQSLNLREIKSPNDLFLLNSTPAASWLDLADPFWRPIWPTV